MPEDIVARVAARFVQADEHNPDPLTFKAFLSEFHQGLKMGQQKAAELIGTHPEGPNVHGEMSVAEDKIAVAASDLLDLARRLESFASQRRLAVNEHRLVPKMSGILSTLFYQMGYVKGLKSET